MNGTKRFTRNPDLIAADQDGDKVMMDLEKGTYFALNPVGSEIWDTLESPQTTENLIETVRDKYDVSQADSLEAEIAAFLEELVTNNIILEIDG